MRGQGPRVRPVRHLLLHREQAEHLLHIDQPLPDLAIDEAQEIERLVKLHQIGVHQHELTYRHGAGPHAIRGQQHDGGKSDRHDRSLTEVQHIERHLAAHRCPLIARQRGVKARRFVPFVAEILHRLVVQQAVDRPRACLVVGLVHGAADAHAEIGEGQREAQIAADRGEGQQREAPVEQAPDDAGHRHHLEDGRDHVEDGKPQNRLDAGRAAIDHPRQGAGLAVEMKAQREPVQVIERLQRQPASCPLLHRSEHCVTQFAEACRAEPQKPIGHDQRRRNHQHCAGRVAGQKMTLSACLRR